MVTSLNLSGKNKRFLLRSLSQKKAASLQGLHFAAGLAHSRPDVYGRLALTPSQRLGLRCEGAHSVCSGQTVRVVFEERFGLLAHHATILQTGGGKTASIALLCCTDRSVAEMLTALHLRCNSTENIYCTKRELQRSFETQNISEPVDEFSFQTARLKHPCYIFSEIEIVFK